MRVIFVCGPNTILVIIEMFQSGNLVKFGWEKYILHNLQFFSEKKKPIKFNFEAGIIYYYIIGLLLILLS